MERSSQADTQTKLSINQHVNNKPADDISDENNKIIDYMHVYMLIYNQLLQYIVKILCFIISQQ